MPLKATSWNIKHAHKLSISTSADGMDRKRRVRETIEEMDPDVLCIIEGPQGEANASAFCNNVLNGSYQPVFIDQAAAPGANDSKYQQIGAQWIWFLVKTPLLPRCRVQEPAVWQHFVGRKDWTVNLWGQVSPTQGDHYRHPQLMIMELPGGVEIEFIGVHLKSKINTKQITFTENGELNGAYLTEALRVRTALAMEARNIREYISAKFEQVPNPGVVVMGDCNDGPGHDFFENQYLFFDLIGNIQGEILVAERFFNHALFDFPSHLRWSAKYDDEIMKLKAKDNPLLLDHILMSQPLCNGSLPLKANAHGGKVEHDVYDRHNVGLGVENKRRTSDHRPVSFTFDDNP